MLIRRSPLVILLCLELMLNAGNLALVAFSRAHGNEEGQVFALIVMVVAACEVVVGLGLIVAMFRRRLPLNVDEMRSLRGDERHHVRVARARVPARRLPGERVRLAGAARPRSGWIGTAAIGLAFLSAIGALVMLLDQPTESRELTSSLWTYASAAGSTSRSGSWSTRCRCS